MIYRVYYIDKVLACEFIELQPLIMPSMNNENKYFKVAISLILISILSGCLSLNSFHRAQTLKNNGIEIQGNSSINTYQDETLGDMYTSDIGVQVGYGWNGIIDSYIRYQHLQLLDYDDISYHYTSVVGKYSVISGNLSLLLPVSMLYGRSVDAEHTFHIKPTILASYPVHSNVVVTAYPQITVFIPSWDPLITIGANVEASFNAIPITVVPDLSYSFTPSYDYSFLSFGIALSYTFNNQK